MQVEYWSALEELRTRQDRFRIQQLKLAGQSVNGMLPTHDNTSLPKTKWQSLPHWVAIRWLIGRISVSLELEWLKIAKRLAGSSNKRHVLEGPDGMRQLAKRQCIQSTAPGI